MRKERTASPTALHRLADELGLLRQYVSAADETRTVADASLRALCAALGFPADTDAAAEQSLSRLQTSRPRLDGVIVVLEGNALETAWRGGQAAGEAVDWRVTRESGDVVEGRSSL